MKWSAAILIFLLVFSGTKPIYAHLLEVNAWHVFNGKLGNKEIQLSLYLFDDGTIKGNYILKDNLTKISVSGKAKANTIILTEINSKDSTAIFKGNIFTDTLDKYEGTWTYGIKNEKTQFYFTLSSINWGDYDHRYEGIYGTTEEIETFVEQMKDSILSGKKAWIVNHIHYPTRHVLDKGFTSINNKQQMMKYYDQVFTAKFKEKIRHEFTTNLFCKNGGVMLGDGELWIGNTVNSTEAKHSFIITAINP